MTRHGDGGELPNPSKPTERGVRPPLSCESGRYKLLNNGVEMLASVDGPWPLQRLGGARSKTAVNQKWHSPCMGVHQSAIVQQSGF